MQTDIIVLVRNSKYDLTAIKVANSGDETLTHAHYSTCSLLLSLSQLPKKVARKVKILQVKLYHFSNSGRCPVQVFQSSKCEGLLDLTSNIPRIVYRITMRGNVKAWFHKLYVYS